MGGAPPPSVASCSTTVRLICRGARRIEGAAGTFPVRGSLPASLTTLRRAARQWAPRSPAAEFLLVFGLFHFARLLPASDSAGQTARDEHQ
jgi:hypothetical protein